MCPLVSSTQYEVKLFRFFFFFVIFVILLFALRSCFVYKTGEGTNITEGVRKEKKSKMEQCTIFYYFIYFLFLTKRKESKEGAKNVPLLLKRKYAHGGFR